ncbi:Aspartyl/glutamyl-tRNA(Asn/Gln) amidotransferase subunit B [Bienertia sinuspersici]
MGGTSNVQKHYNGRILLAWNPNSFTLELETMTDQIMQCVIKPSSGLPEFFCSFIYAHNDAKLRESLWQDLINMSNKMRGPWLLMGDFNCVIDIEERIDIPYSGHFYTWSNKQIAEDRVWSKLDMIMANEEWLEFYKNTNAIFLIEGCLDHCLGLLRINFEVGMGRKPFKYFRMWKLAPDYVDIIKKAWGEEVRGTVMYKLVQKLKRVKASMKELNKQGFNNMQAEDSKRYQEMVVIQEKLHNDLMNTVLMEEEKEATHQYNIAQNKYMQYLKQKAKVAWLREGDDNTALFHSCLQKRTLQNHVYAIRDRTGAIHDSSEGKWGIEMQ